MFCILKNKKVCFAYVSKNNSNREKQVIHLIIPNVEGREQSETLTMRAKSEGRKAKSDEREAKFEGRRQWHYLAVKKLSVFLRGITSNTFILFQKNKNLNRIIKFVKIKIFVT